MSTTEKDKKIIQDLAKKVAEVASQPQQKEKARMWIRHNRLERAKPMVLIFPENSWNETITEKDLLSEDPFCRGVERDLRMRLYYANHLQDDNVIDSKVVSPIIIQDTGWGICAQTTDPANPCGARHYNAVIQTEADIEKIKKPKLTIDYQATEEHYQKLRDLIGGVLPVEKRGPTGFWFAVIDDFAVLRGLDQVYLDMVDRPQWLHRVLNLMTEGWLGSLDFYEKENVLSLNNGAHYCGSGGVGFTDQLPQPDFDGVHVRTKDMWGHATTQMFSEVSPAMHEEFALRYEEKFLARFGLAAYGCCEPLHKKIDIIIKHIPNLQRISMSPWVDVGMAAEKLQDKYIFSWKPNPAVLAAEQWNPQHARKVIRDAMEKTRGCAFEMVMKDVHTCRNDPRRLSEWVKIAKEEAEKF